MKAKVRLTDAFSGRSINVITELVNRRWDMYEFSFESLSDFQRKKIEDFFGKENAYHTKAEIIFKNKPLSPRHHGKVKNHGEQ